MVTAAVQLAHDTGGAGVARDRTACHLYVGKGAGAAVRQTGHDARARLGAFDADVGKGDILDRAAVDLTEHTDAVVAHIHLEIRNGMILSVKGALERVVVRGHTFERDVVHVQVCFQIERVRQIIAVHHLICDIGKAVRGGDGDRRTADGIAAVRVIAAAPRIGESRRQFDQRDQPRDHHYRKQEGQQFFDVTFHT